MASCAFLSSMKQQNTTHSPYCETTVRYGNVPCNVAISHMLSLLYCMPQFPLHMTWHKPLREFSFISLRQLCGINTDCFWEIKVAERQLLNLIIIGGFFLQIPSRYAFIKYSAFNNNLRQKISFSYLQMKRIPSLSFKMRIYGCVIIFHFQTLTVGHTASLKSLLCMWTWSSKRLHSPCLSWILDQDGLPKHKLYDYDIFMIHHMIYD